MVLTQFTSGKRSYWVETRKNDRSAQGGSKAHSDSSTRKHSSPSTSGKVVTTPAKTSTRGTPATSTTAVTPKRPKRTIRPSRCKWLMLGGGAVLLVVLIGVLIYFLVTGSKVDDDKAPSNDSIDDDSGHSSTEQTSASDTPGRKSPATDVTGQDPVINNTVSPGIALAEASDFKVPLAGKIIGGVAGGIVGTYLLAGLAIAFVPCITQPLGVGMYDYSNKPVHAPVGFLDFTLTHPKGPSEGISLGVWYIPIPEKDLSSKAGPKEALARQDLKADDRYVVLVVLVASTTRAYHEALYDIFREEPLHYNVVVFDFRGKADSSPAKNVTFKSLVADLRLVYDWILKTPKSPQEVLLYGNSMGTTVIIEMLSMLKPTQSPRAAILDGALVSLKKVLDTYNVSESWYLTVLQKVPLLSKCVSSGMQNEYGWDSLSKLRKVNCPLLFMAGKDDIVNLYEHSQVLYKAAKKKQPSAAANKTQIHLITGDHQILESSVTVPIINDFVKSLD